MTSRIDTEVFIVGGGPVGLTLAIDLAQRGIEVTVAETRAAATPGLSILNRTRVVDLVQDETGVVATAEDLATGETLEIFSRYLIGCDGAHSEVRHKIGAKMTGDPV